MAVVVDARKIAGNITVNVEIKNKKYFNLGLSLIRLGCWLAGLQYKEQE